MQPPIFFKRGDFMAIIPGTTIEYDDKKHGEVTSAYTYNKCYTAFNVYTTDDAAANQLCRWQFPTQTIRLAESENTNYIDIVWLYNSPVFPAAETLLVTNDENDTLPVITKLDIQKYKLVIDGFYTVKATDAGIADSTPVYHAAGYELGENEYIKRYLTHWENKEDPTETTSYTIPVLRWHQGSDTWYIKIPDNFYLELNNHPPTNQLKATAQTPYDDQTDIALLRAPITAQNTWNLPALGYKFIVGSDEDYTFVFYNPTEQANNLFIALNSVDAMLRSIALLGIYFEYDGTMYLGYMDESGQTTGEYLTADDWSKSAQYDSDNINNYTQHNPPYVPPGPEPGPYDDDPWSGASFSGVSVGGIGAFARCYYMTSTELQNLRSWMGSINVPEGFDPMAQIIGLSQVPVALSGDAAENICFINSSAVYDPGVTTRVVDSGVASQYSMGLPKKFSLGSIDIVRRMQERGEPYLDYSCQIELYLPLIGMFSLDTQTVMGRTIEAEAVLDPVSGTLAAYAWVSKDGQKLPIAYGSTTIGVDLPVTAQQYSVAKAALKQANAQLATSLLSSALTMVASASASGKAAAYGNGRATAASGMRNAREGFNSFTNAASIAASQTMVSQTGSVFGSFMDWGRSIRQLSYGNNTAIAGSFGGSTAQWSYPFTPYVKIIRPRFEKPLNYAHTQGVPCVQAKTVGSCTGFIQCVGVDVSGITRATDIERQAIQAALSNGVYAGGGE